MSIIHSRVQSFKFAIAGLKTVLRQEPNARIHVGAALAVIVLGSVLNITTNEWALLAITISAVWFAETINTAFEHLCDVVCPNKSESVRLAKDIAAGAVLITAIGAVVVGTLIFLPYLE